MDMQTNPPIESFKSMMFKKNKINLPPTGLSTPGIPNAANTKPPQPYKIPGYYSDGTHFADIKFGDLFSDFKTLAEARAREEAGEQRDSRPTLYEQQLFDRFTSKPGHDPDPRVAEARRIQSGWKQRNAALGDAKAEAKRAARFGPTPYHLSDLRGVNGEIIPDDDPVMRGITDVMGYALAREFARTGKASPLQDAENFIYSIIKDPGHNDDIKIGDTNLGLYLHRQLVYARQRAEKADQKAKEKAEEKGEEWDPAKSRVNALPYQPDMTLRSFIQANLPQIYNLALNKGAYYLRNMRYAGGGQNANFSEADIDRFYQESKDATSAQVAEDQRKGLFDYSNPSLHPSSASVLDVGGNLRSSHPTVYNMNHIYPPTKPHSRKAPSSDETIRALGRAAADVAINTDGDFDLSAMISEELPYIDNAVVGDGLEDDVISEMIYGENGLIRRGWSDKDIMRVIGNLDNYTKRQPYRNMGDQRAYEREIADPNRALQDQYSMPGKKPYDPTVRDEGLKDAEKWKKIAERRIKDLRQDIKTVMEEPQSKDRQKRLAILQKQLNELTDKRDTVDEYLGGMEPSKRDANPAAKDFGAYGRPETGSIHILDVGTQPPQGGQGRDPDTVEWYLKGLRKLFLMDDYSNKYKEFEDNIIKKLSRMDDPRGQEFVEAIKTRGQDGVIDVMRELLLSPQKYTFTGDKYARDKQGNLVLRQANVQSPDILYSIATDVNRLENQMHSAVDPYIKGEKFKGYRALDPERYDGVEGMTDTSPTKDGYQSSMSQGPDFEPGLMGTRVTTGDPLKLDPRDASLRGNDAYNLGEARRDTVQVKGPSVPATYSENDAKIVDGQVTTPEAERYMRQWKERAEQLQTQRVQNANETMANDWFEQYGKLSPVAQRRALIRWNRENPDAFYLLQEKLSQRGAAEPPEASDNVVPAPESAPVSEPESASGGGYVTYAPPTDPGEFVPRKFVGTVHDKLEDVLSPEDRKIYDENKEKSRILRDFRMVLDGKQNEWISKRAQALMDERIKKLDIKRKLSDAEEKEMKEEALKKATEEMEKISAVVKGTMDVHYGGDPEKLRRRMDELEVDNKQKMAELETHMRDRAHSFTMRERKAFDEEEERRKKEHEAKRKQYEIDLENYKKEQAEREANGLVPKGDPSLPVISPEEKEEKDARAHERAVMYMGGSLTPRERSDQAARKEHYVREQEKKKVTGKNTENDDEKGPKKDEPKEKGPEKGPKDDDGGRLNADEVRNPQELDQIVRDHNQAQNNNNPKGGKKNMTKSSQTPSAKKSALDIPFSAMLKSANEKAGQEKGLPSGATMKETLPAYYRTVKMVGDHPDAIGFSVYEHKKMNAEDGEEHKTDLPKPIKKGSLEYVEKSSIRDLIEGEHIAKGSFAKAPTVLTGDAEESAMLQDDSGEGRHKRHDKYVKLKDEIDSKPDIKPGDKMQGGKYTYASDYPPESLVVYGKEDPSKPARIHRDGSSENAYGKQVDYDQIEGIRQRHAAKRQAADMLYGDKGFFGTMIDAAINPRDGSSTQERVSNALQERQRKIEDAKQMLVEAGYSPDMVEQMFGKSDSVAKQEDRKSVV